MPSRERVQPFLRDERVVGRDGFVAWERAWYGVPWRWAGKTVRVAADAATVEIWARPSGSPCTRGRRAPGSA